MTVFLLLQACGPLDVRSPIICVPFQVHQVELPSPEALSSLPHAAPLRASPPPLTLCRPSQGLPNGPFGLLGAAEGVSYLAILAGLVVLGFQVTDYGYIPNAIPVEGGKCA